MSGETLGQMMEDIVRGALPELNSYASFWASVISQNEDGTLEVRPDDEGRPPMSDVRIVHSVPGKSVKVAAGSRVLVQLVGGGRQEPIVTHWEKTGLQEEAISAAVRFGVEAPTIELEGTQINVNGAHVRLGGPAGIEALIKGTTYRAAEAAKHAAETAATATLLAVLATPITGVIAILAPILPTPPPPNVADGKLAATALSTFAVAMVAYLTAMEVARSTFEAAVAAVLSTVSSTE